MQHQALDVSLLTKEQRSLLTTTIPWSMTAERFDSAAAAAQNLGEWDKVKELRKFKRFALERSAYCMNACTVAGGKTEETPVWHAKIAPLEQVTPSHLDRTKENAYNLLRESARFQNSTPLELSQFVNRLSFSNA
jgi:hypothetical protein